MPNCDFKIATNITNSCDNPITKGLTAIGYVANYEDVIKASCTRTGNKITNLALKVGAKLVKIYQTGKTPFNGAKSELVQGTVRNNFNKTAPFYVLDSGASVAENIIDKFANGKFIFILENNYQGNNGDNAFEVVGFEQGATASALEQDKYNADTNGGWACTMIEEGAPTSGIYLLYSGGVEATRSALEALLTPVPAPAQSTE